MIVTERSSGAGAIIGVILAVVAILLVIWLLFGMNGDGEGTDVVPDDVNVTVDVDNPTGGDGGGESGGGESGGGESGGGESGGGG